MRRRTHSIDDHARLALAVVFGLLTIGPAVAQHDSEYAAADTSSPRSTLRSFIDGTNEFYSRTQDDRFFDQRDPRHLQLALKILDCIDSRELPAFTREERAAEIAVCLKEILDRFEIPPWDQIPDSEAIEAAGGLEKFERWRIPGTRITITRVDDGPQKYEYLFSPGTAERAVEYYESIKIRSYRADGPETSPGLHDWYMSTPGNPAAARLVNLLPIRLQFGRTLGLANWKWLGLVLTVVLGVLTLYLLALIHRSLARRISRKRIFLSTMILVFPVLGILVPFMVEHVAHNYLSVRGTPLYVVSFVSNIVSTICGVVFIFAASETIAELVIASPHINPNGLNAQLIRIATRLTSLVLAVVVFLVGGQYVGIPVATLLASAGIGGLALALGAQDTLKTLFGTVMLMADKPFRVGDRIIFKTYDGVVEDIGMRSTRLRLLSNHQVTIPNDELARSDIENVGRRECIRRDVRIRIPSDTSYEKTQQALQIVRDALKDHEGMKPDQPPRVYFVEFDENAFTIRMIYWYHPPEFWSFLAFSEQLNFAIFKAFEEHGIRFSLPQRITASGDHDERPPFEVRMV